MKTTLVVLGLMAVSNLAHAADVVTPSRYVLYRAPGGQITDVVQVVDEHPGQPTQPIAADVPSVVFQTTTDAPIAFVNLRAPLAVVDPPAPLPDGGYVDTCAGRSGEDASVAILYSGGVLPDGGAAEPGPTPICIGQRVPTDGVFLTQARAAELAGDLAARKQLADDLKKELAKRPDSPIPGYVWLISCTLSVAASAYLFRKL